MSEVERLRIQEIEGWMELPELEWLYEQGRRASTALEIGTFMGRSACAIMAGLGCREHPTGIGRFIAVDTFDARGTVRFAEVREHGPNWLLEQFRDNAAERGLSDFTVIIGDSHEPAVLAQVPDLYLDFLFIDGSHDFESVYLDLNLWVPKVKPGGIVAGHDYHESWPGVVRAVDDYWRPRAVHNPVGGIWSITRE